MPIEARRRGRLPPPSGLDLPPPFRLVRLREAGDAFAHATTVAAHEGAGTLVHVGRFDIAEFAVVLEPEEPLATARRALYAGLIALRAALAADAPPHRLITFAWPDALHVDGALAGGVRLAWPAAADEDSLPDWLVLGAMARVAEASDDQGIDGPHPARLVESWARHFAAAIDEWQTDGFGVVADSYLAHLGCEGGATPAIDDNGNLVLRRLDGRLPDRRSLAEALAAPTWLDPASGGLRT
ncbi:MULTISPECIES: biotin/lipoate--protein ligase family protein [Inquilinus]|uniref:BPL/LPL catalytic domain-containing protein n=1 Tax=Inquilinus ginsengisoli TaxID=363840 RepID=A0ABU1JTE9_9PROT|nr:biotin/lipoate--protein ligase family protein [Inquilinus ginsengisoli]MDR6291888.1 hypothetical protein [Inquilinus ginsengisoli]